MMSFGQMNNGIVTLSPWVDFKMIACKSLCNTLLHFHLSRERWSPSRSIEPKKNSACIANSVYIASRTTPSCWLSCSAPSESNPAFLAPLLAEYSYMTMLFILLLTQCVPEKGSNTTAKYINVSNNGAREMEFGSLDGRDDSEYKVSMSVIVVADVTCGMWTITSLATVPVSYEGCLQYSLYSLYSLHDRWC